MRCAACNTDNLPGARFCDQCGAPLAVAAPATGATIGLGRPAAPPAGAPLPVMDANPATAAPPPATTALLSVILGLVALAVFCMLLCTVVFAPLALLPAIPAVILGRQAQREIARSGGARGGGGMARAGTILGWITIGLSLLLTILLCSLPALVLGVR